MHLHESVGSTCFFNYLTFASVGCLNCRGYRSKSLESFFYSVGISENLFRFAADRIDENVNVATIKIHVAIWGAAGAGAEGKCWLLVTGTSTLAASGTRGFYLPLFGLGRKAEAMLLKMLKVFNMLKPLDAALEPEK